VSKPNNLYVTSDSSNVVKNYFEMLINKPICISEKS